MPRALSSVGDAVRSPINTNKYEIPPELLPSCCSIFSSPNTRLTLPDTTEPKTYVKVSCLELLEASLLDSV